MDNQVEEKDNNVRKDRNPESVLEEDPGKKMRHVNEEHSIFPPSATKKPRLSAINPASNKKCSLCQFKFLTQSQLVEHYKLEHTENPPPSRQRGEGSLPCQYCNIKFYTSDNLARHLVKSCKKTPAHIQTSTSVATATHPLSTLNSVSRTDIIEQSSTKNKQIGLVHHEERTVSCDSCAKVFGSRYEMKRHKNLTHGDGEGTVPCDNCGKMFTSLVNVKRHRKFCFAGRPEEKLTEQNTVNEKHQIESKESLEDSLAKIPCSDCKKMFLNMKSLMKHRKYSCQVRIRSQSETVKSLVGDHPRDQGEEGTDGEHQQ